MEKEDSKQVVRKRQFMRVQKVEGSNEIGWDGSEKTGRKNLTGNHFLFLSPIINHFL